MSGVGLGLEICRIVAERSVRDKLEMWRDYLILAPAQYAARFAAEHLPLVSFLARELWVSGRSLQGLDIVLMSFLRRARALVAHGKEKHCLGGTVRLASGLKRRFESFDRLRKFP